MKDARWLISIAGPTAVGKTSLAIQIAQRFQAPIISVDSRQMYRYMNIGTAKPSEEEMAGIPHYFIDTLTPDQEYNAGQFEREAEALIDELFLQNQVIIAVGGSTLYFDALWLGFDDMPVIDPQYRVVLTLTFQQHGLDPLLQELEEVDPATFAVIDRRNPSRVIRALEVYRATGMPVSHFRQGRKIKETPYNNLKIGIHEDRTTLYERIDDRVFKMMEDGLMEEVQGLLNKGYSPDLQSLQTIGYREIIRQFSGEGTMKDAIEAIQRNTRHYAKRQMTWFKKYKDLNWFQAFDHTAVEEWLEAEMSIDKPLSGK